MKKNKFINTQGFTLVELMVVVGIIGILATIAIPNFRKYQAKSKTTEAKIQLSSVYTTMESMLLEYDTYASCLTSGGFNPTGDVQNRFYAVGFAAVSTQDSVAAGNGLSSCGGTIIACESTGTGGICGSALSGSNTSYFFYGAGKKAGGSTPVQNVSGSGFSSTTHKVTAADAFVAAAGGIIDSSGSDVDRWSIDNNKKMNHEKVGY